MLIFFAGYTSSEIEERTLIVVYNIAQMVTTAVVSLADTHRVMSKVDIAIIAWEV